MKEWNCLGRRVFIACLLLLPPSSLAFTLQCQQHKALSYRNVATISKMSDQKQNEQRKNYTIHVSYEGRSYGNITVSSDETVLEALERSNVASIACPYDCRRGNCLTCAAIHEDGSIITSLVPNKNDNGLAPHVSKAMQDAGYVLLCSSVVRGDGLRLKLSENNEVWQSMYGRRLSNSREGMEASAKAMRKFSEQNIERWKTKTEEVLEAIGD